VSRPAVQDGAIRTELDVIVRARAWSKTFGGARALDNVNFDLHAGEVHGLVGENGSGKSTFIKILAGFHSPDDPAVSQLEVNGTSVKMPLHVGQARELGMSFVHQDLGLIPSLSVLENLRINSLARSHRWRIDWSREARHARNVFREFNVPLDPTTRVGNLRPVERALLAIMRALDDLAEVGGRSGRRILILDEPTVFLPQADKEQLFGLVKQLAARGDSVIFVSHDLEDVLDISGRITVMRDGRVRGTVRTRETNESQLVQLIIGRELEPSATSERDIHQDPVSVRVIGLTSRSVSDLSLDVHCGEVLGLTGLVGSGYQDVPYCLVGAQRPEAGELHIEGTVMDLRKIKPRQALDRGVALVPADRKLDGAVGSLTIAENLGLPALKSLSRYGALRQRRLVRYASGLMQRFVVRPAEPSRLYETLSGGNQQKALLAKWLNRQPKLLLLDEPTQGVDVGARQQIFTIIRTTAAEGAAVICVSADYEQLATICDRVIVITRGVISAELTGSRISKDVIADHSYRNPLDLGVTRAEA
jgi:ribose transport system ATP-binding protein